MIRSSYFTVLFKTELSSVTIKGRLSPVCKNKNLRSHSFLILCLLVYAKYFLYCAFTIHVFLDIANNKREDLIKHVVALVDIEDGTNREKSIDCSGGYI